MTYYTPRLILKTLDESYAENVLNFYLENKGLFEQYESTRPDNFYTIDYIKLVLAWEMTTVEKGSAVRFWVFEPGNEKKIIGTVSFQNMDHSTYRSCRLGYKFHQSFHHMGYGFEAVLHSCDIIFSDFNIHRIEAHTMPSNIPSIKLLEKVGFQYEGLLRDYAKIQGQFRDHKLYSLISPYSS